MKLQQVYHLDVQDSIELKALQLYISPNLQWLGGHSPSDVLDESILHGFSHCWNCFRYLHYITPSPGAISRKEKNIHTEMLF